MWGMLWQTKELLSTRAEHPIERGRWTETEGWAGWKKKQTLVDATHDVTRFPFKPRTKLRFSIFIITLSNFGFVQVWDTMFKRANQTFWHSGVLTNDKGSLMSRLSMLFHESLAAWEILFVELPLFLLVPVISWLVADDEALLSSSL